MGTHARVVSSEQERQVVMIPVQRVQQEHVGRGMKQINLKTTTAIKLGDNRVLKQEHFFSCQCAIGNI